MTVSSDASLTFTTANWDVPQGVSLSAAADLDATPRSAVVRASAPGFVSAGVTVSITATPASLSLATSPAGQGYTAQLVTVTATASGFLRPQYQLWIYGPHNGAAPSWLSLGAYGASPVFAWTPNTVGPYQLQVWVREAASTAEKDMSSTVDFQVRAPEPVPPGR